jgi:hypothetical protein
MIDPYVCNTIFLLKCVLHIVDKMFLMYVPVVMVQFKEDYTEPGGSIQLKFQYSSTSPLNLGVPDIFN